MTINTAIIDDREYVLVPKDVYEKLRHGDLVEALPYASRSLGMKLKTMRLEAGMTQAILAKKLHCSQTMIAAVEAGRADVGERYIQRLKKVCDYEASR